MLMAVGGVVTYLNSGGKIGDVLKAVWPLPLFFDLTVGGSRLRSWTDLGWGKGGCMR